jgi:hypothetical protein
LTAAVDPKSETGAAPVATRIFKKSEDGRDAGADVIFHAARVNNGGTGLPVPSVNVPFRN